MINHEITMENHVTYYYFVFAHMSSLSLFSPSCGCWVQMVVESMSCVVVSLCVLCIPCFGLCLPSCTKYLPRMHSITFLFLLDSLQPHLPLPLLLSLGSSEGLNFFSTPDLLLFFRYLIFNPEPTLLLSFVNKKTNKQKKTLE